MANVHGINLAQLKADMEAQHRGYSSAESERLILSNANSGKIARKAARKAARARKTAPEMMRDPLSEALSDSVPVGNWTVEQYRRVNPNSAVASAMNELGIS